MREMKDSGVEWVGEMPNTWQILTIGSLFKLRNEKVNDTDYPPLSVSKGGIIPQMENVAKSDANDNRKMVLTNDFVINSRSDRKQSCGVSPLNGSVSLINTVMYPSKGAPIVPSYLNYLLKNYGFAEEFYRWGHGIVADLWTTRWQEMKSILLPITSVDEQEKITEFLNNKCTQVDSLISNVQTQIEKLKAYKQSLITEVVTKGLDPTVPMKDSGVEWIGEIPESWSLIRFKDKWKNKKEIAGESASEYERLALTLNGVIKRPKDDSDGLQPKEFNGYQILRENNFIFKMIDLQNISTSRVGLSPYVGLVSPAYIRFVPKSKEQFSKFTYYFLMSMYYNCVYNNLGGNGVRSALNASDMGAFRIPWPDYKEQQQIADYLDEKCAKIDRLLEIKQQKIEKLNQYKKSLIYEYVTGKREV